LKSSTCMESAEVYAASISVKAGALTRGGLAVSRRSIGRLDAAERPNTQWSDGA